MGEEQPAEESTETETEQSTEGTAEAESSEAGAQSSLLVAYFSYAENAALREEDFSDDVHRALVRYINFCRETGQEIRVSDLFELFGEDTPEFNAILDLNTEERLFGGGAEKYFADCVKTVARRRVQTRMDEITAKIGAETDLSARHALAEELTALARELKNY